MSVPEEFYNEWLDHLQDMANAYLCKEEISLPTTEGEYNGK